MHLSLLMFQCEFYERIFAMRLSFFGVKIKQWNHIAVVQIDIISFYFLNRSFWRIHFSITDMHDWKQINCLFRWKKLVKINHKFVLKIHSSLNFQNGIHQKRFVRRMCMQMEEQRYRLNQKFSEKRIVRYFTREYFFFCRFSSVYSISACRCFYCLSNVADVGYWKTTLACVCECSVATRSPLMRQTFCTRFVLVVAHSLKTF